jgi:NAD-dependent deacetylase
MSSFFPSRILDRFMSLINGEHGRMVVLTGAGISAESGIPTFRGREGYWVVGSREYQPQEMATHAMFEQDPEAVWSWYLYRRGICNRAQPNPGHLAVVEMEGILGDRFRLVTQNVDGLHLRAGSSLELTYQIHGNVDFSRCDDLTCDREIRVLPEGLGLDRGKGAPLTDDERLCLKCEECGGWTRPHVLWFDECYDEEHFYFDSSITAAASAAVLLVVGTSGATNLPMQVGGLAAEKGALIFDVNPEPNPFSRMAESTGGLFLQGPGATVLPAIVEQLKTG